MMSRSGHNWDHSEPVAPEWNFCSQIVHTLASAEISANGTRVATRSRHRIRPLRHQTQSAITAGNMTVDGLLRIATTKNRSAQPKRHQRTLFPFSSASIFKNQKIDKR